MLDFPRKYVFICTCYLMKLKEKNIQENTVLFFTALFFFRGDLM